jgi:hypothetical protein
VDKVSPWVENMSTVYKTLPQSAFERAFKLDPRPDVIYFLSDGFLQGKDPVAHVKALNAVDPKVTIHTIRFSKEQGKTKAKSKAKARTEGAAEQLRAIAENNGGTFRNVSQE